MGQQGILEIAYTQLGNSWKSNPAQVEEYIYYSVVLKYFQEAKAQSWCGHFAYWVLYMAGAKYPEEARPITGPEQWNTIKRFRSVFPETKNPQPGDLYYMPKTETGKNVFHIGFVVEDVGGEYGILTIDGNSWNGVWDSSKGVGGGMVVTNWRDPGLIKWYLST